MFVGSKVRKWEMFKRDLNIWIIKKFWRKYINVLILEEVFRYLEDFLCFVVLESFLIKNVENFERV